MTSVRGSRRVTVRVRGCAHGAGLLARRIWAPVLALGVLAADVSAQQPAAAAQEFAPIELSGTWVSVVTEDWAVRMIAPAKGDFESLPLTQAARDAANRFEVGQSAARACDAYGAPALLRQPGRLRISWQDPQTLRLEMDAGEQTRLLHFDASAPRGTANRQGFSAAEWQYANGFDARRVGEKPQGGRLKVTTDNLTAGLLRKNGVPHSAQTTVTEYVNLLAEPSGAQWLVVTTVIHDPDNLLSDYITSTNFKKEPDGSKFRPSPCVLQ